MLIVDRVEGNIAVCEQDGVIVELLLAQIKGAAREGDVLRLTAEGGYTVDSAATEQRRAQIAARFARLQKNVKNDRP